MKQREMILSRMEVSVRDYVSENPNADFNALSARFGTPNQIVISCLEEMECGELIRELDVKRKVVTIVFATMAVVVLLWAGAVCSALAEHNTRENGYFVEQIVFEAEVPVELEGE